MRGLLWLLLIGAALLLARVAARRLNDALWPAYAPDPRMAPPPRS